MAFMNGQLTLEALEAAVEVEVLLTRELLPQQVVLRAKDKGFIQACSELIQQSHMLRSSAATGRHCRCASKALPPECSAAAPEGTRP
jgi:hypothetical protein